MAVSKTSFTRKKGEVVLEALRNRLGAAAAAKSVGVSRQTLYNWRDENPDFNSAWDDIQESITDEIERSAISRAIEGDTTLSIFMLKTRRRDVYQERIEHTGEGGSPLTIVIRERGDGPQ